MNRNVLIPYVLIILLPFQSCQKKTNDEQRTLEQNPKGTFGYDLAFLKKYKKTVVLTAADNAAAQVVVIPEYQGRVMTSTAGGDTGNSYGWINYALIEAGENQPHINAFGGEDRFWLSPEGGQFSVYFKKGEKFDFNNWQTPAVIDSEPFEVISSGSESVSLRKHAVLENHSGTRFDFIIERKVSILRKNQAEKLLGVTIPDHLKAISYGSENTLINTGDDWTREKGAIGVWILGMFTPGEKTTIVAPYLNAGNDRSFLTDDYFGKIPSDRLIVGNNAVFLKADGKFRSKIGLAPNSVKSVAGSYDAEKKILTIIYFDADQKGDYLKSTWENHQDPYNGDALNAYNDGALEDGSQMGPFYELESSSAVKFLSKDQKLTHHHYTFHFEGGETALNDISEKVLGVKIEQILEVFK